MQTLRHAARQSSGARTNLPLLLLQVETCGECSWGVDVMGELTRSGNDCGLACTKTTLDFSNKGIKSIAADGGFNVPGLSTVTTL